MKSRSEKKGYRLFLDANILFSVAWGSQGLRQLWELSGDGRCLLLTSDYVLEEVYRNIKRANVGSSLEDYVKHLQVVTTPYMAQCPIDLPEKDRPIMTAAVAAKATHLITGDLKRFGPWRGQTFQGVLICTARDYLQSL